ncbi:unnamed protein product [Clavelina lepadiformis]|uniref:Transmembrane protein 195 n=1 Tax=Clavelina lepadiformis TaxID=159417 RepID=A0ABP0FUT9_CLALP
MNVSQITLVPHLEAYKPGFFESLRSLFYFILPSESSFRDINSMFLLFDVVYVNVCWFVLGTACESFDVSTFSSESAVPAFFSLIFLELILCLLRGRRTLRVNDTITSLNAGVASRLIRLVSKRSIELVLYINVYDRFRLFDLPWDSNYTWILSFIGMDFAYYWFHRLAHEVNNFWISHHTHHSSEDYNLATALRHSSLQGFVSMFIYLPNALFIPPSVHLVHSQVNILFQFWIHTELIDNLGPLEYILNTPSHHRVHHGRKPYCIDKNYAGALIIWDCMFGTFAAERKEEDLAYGLVHPLNSFDPIYVQLGSLQSLCVRFWNMEGFWNKISVLVKGPAWSPGKPRCGDFNDLPQVNSIARCSGFTVWMTLHPALMFCAFTRLLLLYCRRKIVKIFTWGFPESMNENSLKLNNCSMKSPLAPYKASNGEVLIYPRYEAYFFLTCPSTFLNLKILKHDSQ